MEQKDHLQISLCASFVIEPLEDYLEYWCKELGLTVDIQFAPYNQVFQQLLNPASLLNKTHGINFLFIRVEDWLRDLIDQPIAAQLEFLEKTASNLLDAIQRTRRNSVSPLIIGIVAFSDSDTYSSEVAAEINRHSQ